MNRIILIVAFLLNYPIQYSFGQTDNVDCYTRHQTAYEKISYDKLPGSRLKKILKPFFTLSETDSSTFYFYTYKPQVVNDSVESIKIEKGLAKGYNINLKCQVFHESKHALKFENHELCLIDNKIFWGTDGDMPMEEIKSLTVQFNNQIVPIAPGEFKDLFNPLSPSDSGRFINLLAKMDKKGEYFVIVLFGSDGAGSYSVAWIFKNGKYLRRVVDSLC